MKLTDVNLGDRVEVYTPATGTYWGFVVAVHGDEVELDGIAPTGPHNHQPARVPVAAVTRVIPGVRRDPAL